MRVQVSPSPPKIIAKALGATRGGSSPPLGTIFRSSQQFNLRFLGLIQLTEATQERGLEAGTKDVIGDDL